MVLPAYNLHLWPQRLVDAADEGNDETCICYWVIGLPTIPPPELSISKQFLREWQGVIAHDFSSDNSTSKNTVQTRFIPRKVFLQQALIPSGSEGLPKDDRQFGDTFKKISGSNPHQIRRQFLQHVMGSEGTKDRNHQPSCKLRPAKDVLNRLRYDPTCDIDDYVIGYIDREAGILEKSIPSFENFDQEDHIAYFKQVSKDRIIWDRAKKIDRLFASGNS
jgi:uncharacterized protein (UPF0248 family)